MFPKLLAALAILRPDTTVEYALWVPADPSTVPDGEVGGAWAAASEIPHPYSVDVPSGASRVVTVGGEQIQVDLRVFCRAGVFPGDVTPASSRAPRVTYEGIRYRVLAVTGYGSVSGHVQVLCAKDLGRESA